MYKEALTSLEGVSIFPIIAILIFFVFFVALLIYVIRMDKKIVDEMASIPLDPSEFPLTISSNRKSQAS